MCLSGSHIYTAKGEIHRGASIMEHSNRIPHVHCCTYHSIDAHVAHRTYDHDILGINRIQLLLEISFSESINVFFTVTGS